MSVGGFTANVDGAGGGGGGGYDDGETVVMASPPAPTTSKAQAACYVGVEGSHIRGIIPPLHSAGEEYILSVVDDLCLILACYSDTLSKLRPHNLHQPSTRFGSASPYRPKERNSLIHLLQNYPPIVLANCI